MVFSKSFPRYVGKSNYPVWEEINLSDSEEKEVEREAILSNIYIMEKCIDNAKRLMQRKKMDITQSDTIKLATALFEKRASHEVFFKENKCKEKFDKKFGNKVK